MDVQQTPYGQVSTSSGVSPDNHEVEAPRKLAFAVSGLTERQQIALAMRQSSASDATPNERAGAAAAAAAAAGAMLRVKNATTLPSSHQKATPKPKHALRAKEVNPVAVRIDVAVAEGDVDGADASSSSSSPSTTAASSGHTFEGEGVYRGEMKSGKRHGAGRMEWCVTPLAMPMRAASALSSLTLPPSLPAPPTQECRHLGRRNVRRAVARRSDARQRAAVQKERRYVHGSLQQEPAAWARALRVGGAWHGVRGRVEER
tara:strand:+ start:292 stop:1071 length:780 start_codon:yes stop_codon:yes gene_type:complete